MEHMQSEAQVGTLGGEVNYSFLLWQQININCNSNSGEQNALSLKHAE